MIALLIAVAAQTAAPAPAAAAASPAPAAAAASPISDRFSILADPCASAVDAAGHDVVVCGRPDALSPRIPLRDYRGVPDHGVPSNPGMSGMVALNGPGVGNECGAYGEDCPGQSVFPSQVLRGAAGLVKSAFAKHPDKRRRVAIDLDAPAPAGRLAP